MIRIFTILPVFIVLISCSEGRRISPDEPEPPAKVKLTGLLKSVTVKWDAGETKTEYEYADSLTLKSIRYTGGGKSMTETFAYENDTLKTSQAGDTLKKYFYGGGKLIRIEKHVSSQKTSYLVINFSYFADGQARSLIKRLHNYQDDKVSYAGEFTINWQGKNVSMFRERYADGLFEEHDFQYGEPRNPFNRLHAETLRITPENPMALSYNSPTGYITFVAGMKYKVEGKYLENRLPLTQTISEFDIQMGTDWEVIKQYTFEYYE